MKSNDYWDNYYSGMRCFFGASDFAKFVLSTYSDFETLIDVGCGEGRDSIYFGLSGKTVIGLDGSAAAIDACKQRLMKFESINVNFFKYALDQQTRAIIPEITPQLNMNNTIIYSRFFLHAIEEQVESAFLCSCSNIMHKETLLAVEFRTENDRELHKCSPDHFRRFISTDRFKENCLSHGLSPIFSREGRGLAIFNSEDAHVCRMILVKNYD